MTHPRELTFRAVAAGVVIGALLAVGNIYLSLKVGWWDPGGIAASIVGFALLTPLGRLRGRRYGPLENNITATTAVAVSAMPSTIGLLGAVPALELLGHSTPTWSLVLWGLVLGALGVLVGLALRRRFVVDTALPFPTATATAEVISALHSGRQVATERTRSLLGAAALAMAIGWLRDGRPALIPGTVNLPGRLAGVPLESLSMGFTVSPMLLFAGHLIGPHIALSLLGGAAVAWGGLAPILVNGSVVSEASFSALVAWLVWPGVALMVSSSLTSLFASWRSLGHALAGLFRRDPGGSKPWRAWLPSLAVALCAMAVVLVGKMVFGIPPWLGLLVVATSIVVLAICIQTVGETDTLPIGSLGQLMQIVLGLVSPGAATINIGGASVGAGAAPQSANAATSFKVGHLLHGSPGRLLVAQLVGVAVGSLLVVPVYTLITRAYGLGSPALPVPAVLPWKTLAEVAGRGAAAVPAYAGVAVAAALVAGCLLTLLARTRFRRYVPSPIAMGVAFVVPASSVLTMALGTFAGALVARRWPIWSGPNGAAAAAGGIAGESVMGVLIAILIITGLL